MMKLSTFALITLAIVTISACGQNVKQPKESAPSEAQQAWDNLPVDYDTDEEFFNSIN
jgi:hypothetical protein|tara:strand:+ start:262 stop:435 length:174 start_codon:yes stop_codon:yes gene_type:complete